MQSRRTFGEPQLLTPVCTGEDLRKVSWLSPVLCLFREFLHQE
jgi:hypothetical protein